MKSIILKLITLYQSARIFRFPACRFIPSCSRYTYQAVAKYGTINGLWLGLKRIIRCHPFSKGGPDPLK